MKFTDSHEAITPQDLGEVEAKLDIKLPPSVRALYLSANGGVPKLHVFESDRLDTLVAEFVPLKSETADTAVNCYKDLVLGQNLVPRYFFPFAVDAGGDYFFVDTTTPEGAVYFYRHDRAGSDPLLSLRIGFDQFWSLLRDEP